MINFRFLHFKSMAKRTNIYDRIYVSCMGNQLLSPIFADYISIFSKLRRNTAEIQGIWMDYQNKTLFL